MPPELDYATMTSDILLKGNLRKAKSWSKRFFVLRDGSPAKLEYYENEKKWKSNNGKPKRRFNLERPWNIGKKKDTKHEFLIVIFTEEEYLSMAAENSEVQEQWLNALQKSIKPEPGFRLFQYMWHVTVENKELVGEKNNTSSMTSLHGPHRICLTHDQMVFVPATNTGSTDYSRGTPIEIPITKIRICGHKEGMFFIQPGRSSGIGHGNLWLDLGDEVMAANMHQTILRVMYALNQEEANAYRGRSFSSGSNASRTRSVRSHHNNPPPSQIGMGKASNNRIRCDSLPVTNLNGANESRLRTGSEGEHTMKKPPRFCNVRSGSGSASPGMRSRKAFSQNKRGNPGQYHHSHHHVSHSHSTSLSGSCNGSSPTSSTECLSMSSSTMEPMSTTSSGYYTARAVSNQSSLSIASDATLISTSANPTLNDASELQENQSYASQPVGRSYERHYCTNCFAHIPYFDVRNDVTPPFFSSEKAPSPPDIEPPHPNITASNSNGPEYVNISVHSRAQSADENMSSDTAFSSLSGSPQQVSFNLQGSQIPVQRSGSDASSSSKGHSATHASENSLDEYTAMDVNSSVGKYPHQKMSGNFQKPSSSIFAKFASITGVSSDSRKKNPGNVDVDYTPMTPTTTASSKTPTNPCNDYVPMRSFAAKHSTPQDISYRRRSIPDGYHRTSAGSSLRSSPPYDFSPGDKYYESGSPLQSLCFDCQRRLASNKSLKTEDLSYTEVIPGSARSDSGFKLLIKTKNYETSSETVPPTVHVTVSEENPQNLNSPAESMSKSVSLQSLLLENQKIGISNQIENNPSNLSSSPVATEINGYLPMNPINSQGTRKTVVGNILSVAENVGGNNTVSPPAQYPHQKRSQNESFTNSLDRSKRSPRTRRLKPFGGRSVGSTKRSQSLKQVNKTSNENTNDVRNRAITSSSFTPPSPPPSPAGEYVNIDYAKAQEQLKLKSPHLVHSEDEENITNTLSFKQPVNDDSEYAVMTFIDKEDNVPETTT